VLCCSQSQQTADDSADADELAKTGSRDPPPAADVTVAPGNAQAHPAKPCGAEAASDTNSNSVSLSDTLTFDLSP